MSIALKNSREKQKIRKLERNAILMINNMPEWQKKDLNVHQSSDLKKYTHYL